jgi:hypothetical protein
VKNNVCDSLKSDVGVGITRSNRLALKNCALEKYAAAVNAHDAKQRYRHVRSPSAVPLDELINNALGQHKSGDVVATNAHGDTVVHHDGNVIITHGL